MKELLNDRRLWDNALASHDLRAPTTRRIEMTECTSGEFVFETLNRRQVVARFDGGDISSDGGAILLRETEVKTAILRRFAGCFTDGPNPGGTPVA